MKNLFKTLAVVVILVLTTVSFTSCETEPLPEPESKTKLLIGEDVMSYRWLTRDYDFDGYKFDLELNFERGKILIKNATIMGKGGLNYYAGNRTLTNDSIGYANNADDIKYGNRIIVLERRELIRYKNAEDLTVEIYY